MSPFSDAVDWLPAPRTVNSPTQSSATVRTGREADHHRPRGRFPATGAVGRVPLMTADQCKRAGGKVLEHTNSSCRDKETNNSYARSCLVGNTIAGCVN